MSALFNDGTIEELCNVEYGTRVVRKKDAGTIYPVYGGGGETFFLDTFNRENRVVVARFAMSEKSTRRIAGKFALNDSGLTLSPRDTAILRQDYLDYFVLSINDQIYDSARGTAQKNLDVPAFREMKISYPISLEMQHEIVEKLDSAFAEIESLSTKKNYHFAYSKELFRAVCKSQIELLNPSSYAPLKELSALITKGTTPTTLGHKFKDNGINFIKVEAIDESGNLIPERFAYIDDSAHKALLRSQLQENDVLVSITGALGRSTLVGLQHIPANISQNLAIVRLPIESKVTYEYLASLFMSGYFDLNDIGAGVAQQALSLAQIGSLQVPILTKENQTKFIKFIQESQKSTDILCSNLKSQQLLFAKLRNAILSTAFQKAA